MDYHCHTYTEHVWQLRINYQCVLKGCAISPSVFYDSVCFNSFLNREIECLTLSLLYTNNLLNSFLFHHFPTICSSLMCGCGEAEQTNFHIVLDAKGHQLAMLVKQLTNLTMFDVATLTIFRTKIYCQMIFPQC